MTTETASSDNVLKTIATIPYAQFLGVKFEVCENGLNAELPFKESHIGNPILRALHGGVSSAFLELTASVTLIYETRDRYDFGSTLAMPKPITITVDYLRPGLPQSAFAYARIKRAGRRFASVDVEAWQDDPARPFVTATCHFQMPKPAT